MQKQQFVLLAVMQYHPIHYREHIYIESTAHHSTHYKNVRHTHWKYNVNIVCIKEYEDSPSNSVIGLLSNLFTTELQCITFTSHQWMA